jgi:hypothetical protein
MRFASALALAVCILAGMATAAPPRARAQALPTFDVSPTSGPIGTEISVSGVCTNQEVRMFFQRVSDDVVFAADVFPVDDVGNWSGVIVVPSEAMGGGEPTTPGIYELRGDCRSPTDPTLNYFYEFVPFEVTADGDGGAGTDPVVEIVEALPPTSLRSTGPGTRTAMLSILADAESAIASGDVNSALRLLRNVQRHTDGCGTQPDRNDWVTDCDAQAALASTLDALIGELEVAAGM